MTPFKRRSLASHLFAVLFGALYIVLFVPRVSAQRVYAVDDVPNVQLADSSRFVSDEATILSLATRRDVDDRLQLLRQQYGVECAVVLLPSIGDEAIEDFATELFRKWGLGSSKDHSGVLLLAVMDQKKFRIATGYGIEGVLPDAICRRIIDEYIVPYFRTGNYDKGILGAVEAISSTIHSGEYEGAQRTYSPAKSDDLSIAFIERILFYASIIGLIFFVSGIISLYSIEKSSKYKGLTKISYAKYRAKYTIALLIFICFPLAILFYAWYRLYKRRLILLASVCPRCKQPTLREYPITQEDQQLYLDSSQQLEQSIGSVDYALARCSSCHFTETFIRREPLTKYKKCPKCGTKAYYLYKEEHISSLQGIVDRKYYKCLYCNYNKNDDSRLQSDIDKFVLGTILGRSIGRRGGGGFGGGFGGGGFGGGSTGGGGASGGW